MSAYRRLPVLDKMRYARLSAPPALWRCRLCGVKVLARDQAGHTERAHAGASHGWDMVRT